MKSTRQNRKSKNVMYGRVRSACGSFGRITTFGRPAYGPTHYGCGPGFKKDYKKRSVPAPLFNLEPP